MNTRDFESVLTGLMDNYCMLIVGLEFVGSVKKWCEAEGIEEPDANRPMRFIAGKDGRGCKLVVSEVVMDNILEERINALRVRAALVNVAHNRADDLNSDKKKVAYLFLSEYASTLPDLDDEQVADEWCFKEMERLGFFRE